jgi:hypothetical protein
MTKIQPTEPDSYVFNSLETFLDEVVDFALLDHDKFWDQILSHVFQLSAPEVRRLYSQIDTCGLRKILLDNENASDHHFHFVPSATYAGMLEAILGIVKDPVSAYEIYSANSFQENPDYYNAFRALYQSKAEPRDYAAWLVDQAFYNGLPLAVNRFYYAKILGDTPAWIAERKSKIHPLADFWGRPPGTTKD